MNVVYELGQRLFHDANAQPAFKEVFSCHPTGSEITLFKVPLPTHKPKYSPDPFMQTISSPSKPVFCEWSTSGSSTTYVCASGQWTELV